MNIIYWLVVDRLTGVQRVRSGWQLCWSSTVLVRVWEVSIVVQCRWYSRWRLPMVRCLDDERSKCVSARVRAVTGALLFH